MPRYKLSYFNVRARAEPIRLLFIAAGIPFDDHRIEQTEWPNLKDRTPGKVLPVLEVDGEVLTQSLAITRHIARVSGLDGGSLKDMAKVDELTEYLAEMNVAVITSFFKEDKEAALKATMGLVEKTCDFVEDQIQKNNRSKGAEGFAVGTKLSLADLFIFSGFEALLGVKPDTLDQYKGIQRCREMVANQPKIAAYLENRPKTDL